MYLKAHTLFYKKVNIFKWKIFFLQNLKTISRTCQSSSSHGDFHHMTGGLLILCGPASRWFGDPDTVCHFYADPDPTCYFDPVPDPDPEFHFDPEPDPWFLKKVLK
jgi:hypothetical protein